MSLVAEKYVGKIGIELPVGADGVYVLRDTDFPDTRGFYIKNCNSWKLVKELQSGDPKRCRKIPGAISDTKAPEYEALEVIRRFYDEPW